MASYFSLNWSTAPASAGAFYLPGEAGNPRHLQGELQQGELQDSHVKTDARAEIEFIATDQAGHVIPLEVKSGKQTKAKSLPSYVEKCNPTKTIKLVGTQGSSALEKQHFVYPLYYTTHVVKKHLQV